MAHPAGRACVQGLGPKLLAASGCVTVAAVGVTISDRRSIIEDV